MKTNAIKLVGKIIGLGELRHFEGKNGSVATIIGRIAIPQPIRVMVDDKPTYKDTIMDFQCIGKQAEFIDKYIRAYHKTDNGQKGGFIARLVSVSCFLEVYKGKVMNEDEVSVELEDCTVDFARHDLEIQGMKVRLNVLSLDALDYIEKEEEEKPEKKSGSTVKAKVTPKGKTSKSPAKSKAVKNEEEYNPIEDYEDDELPF